MSVLSSLCAGRVLVESLPVIVFVLTATVARAGAEPSEDDLTRRFVLVGVVLGHRGGPVAVIEDRVTGQDALYHVGDPIADAAVVAVAADRAVLRTDGRDVELRLATSSPARGRPGSLVPRPPSRPRVDRLRR